MSKCSNEAAAALLLGEARAISGEKGRPDMKHILCLAAILQLVLPGQAQDGYLVFQRFPLSKTLQGADGELQLLQDRRLPTTAREELWGRLAPEVGDLWQQFKNDPPHNAFLRVVASDGRVTEQQELEQPLAGVEPIHLYGDARITYFVTVDNSTGFGSYAGPTTSLAEVAAGRLKWLDAADRATGKRKPIILVSSLKNHWKVENVRQGKGKEILVATCSPSGSGTFPDFVIAYARYFFDGHTWVVLERQEKGYSDFEQGFPDRKLFP
jgi:hypothetical protein